MIKQLVTFDWALKKLLRSKVNFDILEGFLSELLFEDVKIKEILESESNKHTFDDKHNRVDMLVVNSSGELIIIEIQQSVEHDYFQRMLFGTCKAVTDFMYAGSKYSNIKKVISISIVTFDLGHGEDYIYRGSTNFIGMNKHDELQLSTIQKQQYSKNSISDIYPEYYLLKVNQFNDYAKNTLDEWIYFLKNSEIKDNFTAKGLSKAKTVFATMNMSQDERGDYEKHLDFLSYMASLEETREIDMKVGIDKARREGVREGMEKGMERGREQGKHAATITIAKTMLSLGIDKKKVSESTGLSLAEVEGLWNLYI